MASQKPSETELQILSLLWEQGPLTIHAIRDGLSDGKKRAYTTVLTLVQIMEKKGFVDHTREGTAHVYRPLVKRQQVLRPLMRDMLRGIFGNSPAKALQCLLDSTQLDKDELAQIRKVIKEADEKTKGDAS